MVTKDTKDKEKKTKRKNSTSVSKSTVKKVTVKNKKTRQTKKATVKKTATKNKTTKKAKATAKTGKVTKNKTTKSTKTDKTKISTRKKTTTKNKKISNEAIILPTDVSQRSIEKSILIRENWEAGIQLFMYYLAYVSAFVFMIIGSAILLTDTFGSSSLSNKNMVATVSKTKDTKIQQQVDYEAVDQEKHLTKTKTTNSYSQLAQNNNNNAGMNVFFENLPVRMTKNTNISFSINNLAPTDKVRVSIFNTRTPLVSELKVNKTTNGKFSTKVTATAFPAGYYRLNAMVLRNGKALVSKNSTEFKNGSDEAIKEALSKIKIDNTQPQKLNIDNSGFYFKTSSGKVLTGVSRIELKASKYLPYVELYARPVTGGKKILVSRGGRLDDGWFFSFDSGRLSNGKYKFIATSKFGDKFLQSNELLMTVSNTAASKKNGYINKFQQKTQGPTLKKTVKSDLSENDRSSIDFASKKEAEKLLKAREEEIKSLTTKYVTAVTNGDNSMMKRVESDFEALRTDIVLASKNNENTKDIADNIAEQLKKQTTKIKERVSLFENFKNNRVSDIKDSDKDGISDYDEVNIYNTDPKKSDTDSDGIDDATELLQQTSPVKSKSKIEFESPKQTIGLTRPDVLSVSKVKFIPKESSLATEEKTPKSETESNENKNNKIENILDEKKLTVSGKALPNSFVTLFIYSLPTVVSVKTDDDGKFTYIFDKELEDGKHDIYVAVTNVDGRILAQSETFSFVKKAEAVSFVDDVSATKESITENLPIETNKSYRSVIGVSILAFGLILLMMGISLRPKKKTIVEDIVAD